MCQQCARDPARWGGIQVGRQQDDAIIAGIHLAGCCEVGEQSKPSPMLSMLVCQPHVQVAEPSLPAASRSQA